MVKGGGSMLDIILNLLDIGISIVMITLVIQLKRKL